MPRVLLGDFEPLMSIGLRDALSRSGIDMIERFEAARGGLDDLVLIVPSGSSSRSEIRSLIDAHPGTTIIECSASDREMRVYRSGSVESDCLELSTDRLISTISRIVP